MYFPRLKSLTSSFYDTVKWMKLSVMNRWHLKTTRGKKDGDLLFIKPAAAYNSVIWVQCVWVEKTNTWFRKVFRFNCCWPCRCKVITLNAPNFEWKLRSFHPEPKANAEPILDGLFSRSGCSVFFFLNKCDEWKGVQSDSPWAKSFYAPQKNECCKTNTEEL